MLLENSSYSNITTVNYSSDSNSNLDTNIYSQLQEEFNRQGFGELDVDGIIGKDT
ncbi:hypothetical protein NNC19_13795 [Clostridium sp. SHJSY1]|uniref:hypothetical protein n=1 Tax=Clostridium sp. SHJSY1 TaxID=2942483 RepID=UPI0028761D3B|nr:hypothetical protein [Clostridium sp. SHJSY1]MDS0526760.1 hypothetical protein [Clostridium sp. SHJSY1]